MMSSCRVTALSRIHAGRWHHLRTSLRSPHAVPPGSALRSWCSPESRSPRQVAPPSRFREIAPRRATGIASIPVSWCSRSPSRSCSDEPLPSRPHLFITGRKIALDLLLVTTHPPPHARPAPDFWPVHEPQLDGLSMSVPDLAAQIGGVSDVPIEPAAFARNAAVVGGGSMAVVEPGEDGCSAAVTRTGIECARANSKARTGIEAIPVARRGKFPTRAAIPVPPADDVLLYIYCSKQNNTECYGRHGPRHANAKKSDRWHWEKLTLKLKVTQRVTRICSR
ncbi:MAG: hypothetical protein GIKADHBN_03598 [Phycisphaerales bacterium]|nr:hypothetical protein [Phycisphaerales bacterium]